MIRSSVRSILSPVINSLRRGRIVAWTPHWMGFGNVLLLAQWAEEGRRHGDDRWILEPPVLEPWMSVFPGLRRVVLRREEVRFTDQRVMPWSAAERAKAGRHVSAPHEPIDVDAVERFIRLVLLPGSSFAVAPERSGDMVINVRRGDYYSNPEIRLQYGFDVEAYVRTAVEQSVDRDGPPGCFVVVSDDQEWCRGALGWLDALAPTRFPTTSGPIEDFAVVASAKRLVITNSTFSYWAAHVGNVLHGDNHAQVWAPRFFDRSQNGGRSWLLDERWSVVENLPEGWDEAESRFIGAAREADE